MVGQALQNFLDLLLHEVIGRRRHGAYRILVLNELAEVTVTVFTDGCLEADRKLDELEEPTDLLGRHVQLCADLFSRGHATELPD